MKRLLFLLFFFILSRGAFAQEYDLYGRFGFNLSSLNISSGSSSITQKKPILSISGELYTDIPYGPFSLQPGFEFTGKGGQYLDNTGVLKTLRIYYFEFPVNIVYNLHIKKDKLFFGVGPYASAGFGGTVRTSEEGKKSVKSELKLFKYSSLYRIGDIGGGGVVGYQFESGVLFSGNVETGAANILTSRGNTTGDAKMRTMMFSLSIGQLF